MAKLPNGINGPFIGRIGNLVFYILNGENICREIGECGPHNNNQKGNSAKMSLISPFIATVQSFIEIGFRATKKTKAQSSYAYALSVNMKAAVTGTYPKQKIAFAKAKFSEGEIAVPKTPTAVQNENILELRWKADLEGLNADQHDQIMAMVYFPGEVRCISLTSGAKRTEEFQSLQIPAFTKKTEMFIHMAFINEDRTDVSNSVFVKKLIWNPTT